MDLRTDLAGDWSRTSHCQSTNSTLNGGDGAAVDHLCRPEQQLSRTNWLCSIIGSMRKLQIKADACAKCMDLGDSKKYIGVT